MINYLQDGINITELADNHLVKVIRKRKRKRERERERDGKLIHLG